MEGRTHSRRTRVSLSQGLTDVILEPANDSLRLPDQTFDVTFGRTFSLGSGTSLTLDAQVLNILNDDTYDYLEDAAYGRGQFVAADYILPRRVMLRASLDFGGRSRHSFFVSLKDGRPVE